MKRMVLIAALVALTGTPVAGAHARISPLAARHIIMTSPIWNGPQKGEQVWWRGCRPYGRTGQRCSVDDRMIWCTVCIDRVTLRLTFDVFGPHQWFEVDVENVKR